MRLQASENTPPRLMSPLSKVGRIVVNEPHFPPRENPHIDTYGVRKTEITLEHVAEMPCNQAR